MLTLVVKYKTLLSILVFLGLLFFVQKSTAYAADPESCIFIDEAFRLTDIYCDPDARTVGARLHYRGKLSCDLYNMVITKTVLWQGNLEIAKNSFYPGSCECVPENPEACLLGNSAECCDCCNIWTDQYINFPPVAAPQHPDETELEMIITAKYLAEHDPVIGGPEIGGWYSSTETTGPCLVSGVEGETCTREFEMCSSASECCGNDGVAPEPYICYRGEGSPFGHCARNPDLIYTPPEVREYSGPIVDYQGLINSIYAILMPAAILLFGLPLIILNGYKIMTSQGNPQKIQEGKEGLTSAIIGLIFVLLAMSILRIILNTFIGADVGL